MLEKAHVDDERVFSPTELYKEGWMPRVILSILEEGGECSPFTFKLGARWFSEAEIRGPFQTRKGERKRDPKNRMDEGPTYLDGVIGHFTITP
jgi:hypothetical protein